MPYLVGVRAAEASYRFAQCAVGPRGPSRAQLPFFLDVPTAEKLRTFADTLAFVCVANRTGAD